MLASLRNGGGMNAVVIQRRIQMMSRSLATITNVNTSKYPRHLGSVNHDADDEGIGAGNTAPGAALPLLLPPSPSARQFWTVPAEIHNANDWLWQQVKIPKGFENFFPKGGGGGSPKKPSNKKKKASSTGDDNEDGTKSDEKENSTETKKKKKKKKKQQFGGGGFGSSSNSSNNSENSAPNDPSSNIGGLTTLLLLVLMARQLIDNEQDSNNFMNGREITWRDFRNHLLQDTERLVVVNKKFARVYLRDSAPGMPPQTQNSATGRGQQPRRRQLLRQQQQGGERGADFGGTGSEMMTSELGGAEWNDETKMDWGSSSAASASSDQSSFSMLANNKNKANKNVYHFYIGSVDSLEEKLARTQQDMGLQPRDFVPLQYVNETNWTIELIQYTPALVMVGLTFWFLRGSGGAFGRNGGMGGGGAGGGIFQIGKSNAQKINKEDVSVTFNDVAGCHEAKKEIMEFVDFLQDSTRFTKLGAKIPKGALLCGPPGTGKTLLAKAVAGEAGVPFYSISGSDFIEMFVGVGPSRVRDLFKEARTNAPCIVFIDEIDAVGRQRGRGGFSGGNDERENTLNQLLVEMDGFSPTTGVVVLAGTNRVDILDQALTRPGRFDRQITVDKPDLQGRKEIFQVHLKGLALEDEVDDIAGRLAGLTPGFAGADIANICNEAAIVAARRKAESVALPDFEKATDRVIGGLESNKIMSKEERSIVAYHEAGHAIAGWFLEHADPLLKVTIIPRTSGALGFAQYLPKEVFLRTQDQIMDIVCMALAGRAAEEVFFGRVTTGASDDLRRVTELVYSTIQVYGMNSRVGQLAFPKNQNGLPGDKPYSDATAEAMDEEARAVVDAAYRRTVELIRERKDEVEAVALKLLEAETITHDDIVDLVGPRPYGDAQYQEYVSKRHVTDRRDGGDSEENNKNENKEEADSSTPGAGGFTPGLA